jgi:hypothetical protein
MAATHTTHGGRFTFIAPTDDEAPLTLSLSTHLFPNGTLSDDATKWAAAKVSQTLATGRTANGE